MTILIGVVALTAKSRLSITLFTILLARINENGSVDFFKSAPTIDRSKPITRALESIPGYLDHTGVHHSVDATNAEQFVEVEAVLDCIPFGWPVPLWVRSEVTARGRRPGTITQLDHRLSREQLLAGVAKADQQSSFGFLGTSLRRPNLTLPPKPRIITPEERLLNTLKKREHGRMATVAARAGGIKYTILWDRIALLALVLIAAPSIVFMLGCRGAHVLRRRLRARSIHRAAQCRFCRYPIAGLRTPVCPECGRPIPHTTEAHP